MANLLPITPTPAEEYGLSPRLAAPPANSQTSVPTRPGPPMVDGWCWGETRSATSVSKAPVSAGGLVSGSSIRTEPGQRRLPGQVHLQAAMVTLPGPRTVSRSEERRVGKEG